MIKTELMAHLSALAYEGAMRMYGTINPEIKRRIEYELAFIEINGGVRELLFAREIVDHFKERNKLMLFGRGAAAASILCYCLDLTSIDPFRYGLLSESIRSNTFTDIEMESSESGRKELLESFPDVIFFHSFQRPEITQLNSENNSRQTISLGLDALTIMEDALELICHDLNRRVDIDSISFDDEKTFQLFHSGETDGVWQFESPGMRRNLRQLKLDSFEQLVMLNAMYRPGPMDNIPEYIARKNENREVLFGIPKVDEILAPTYGFIVYREQIMQIMSALTGISLAEANIWVTNLGKKMKSEVDQYKERFLKRFHHDKAEELWTRMENDVVNTFQKSHSVHTIRIAYIQAYLKVHFNHEYMIALNEFNKIRQTYDFAA